MTKRAAGEHRKTTASATSSGSAQRPSGVRARIAALRCGSLCNGPVSAVFTEGDGLGLVRRLVAAARRRLAPDGLLALQIRGRIHSARQPDLPALEYLLDAPATLAA